jgi:hypothetical protein
LQESRFSRYCIGGKYYPAISAASANLAGPTTQFPKSRRALPERQAGTRLDRGRHPRLADYQQISGNLSKIIDKL